MWSPSGFHSESKWSPSGVQVESKWSPSGVQMDFVQNCRLKSFPDGVHVESIWNLWGRVKYRKKPDLTGLKNTTSESCTSIWCKAPVDLPLSKIDLWNAFVETLLNSCSNWSQTQAMIQFQVFKGWSNNYLSQEGFIAQTLHHKCRISAMLAPNPREIFIPWTLQILCGTSLITSGNHLKVPS